MIKAGSGRWKTTFSKLTSLLAPPRTVQSKSIDANYSVSQSSIKVGACYSWTDSGTLEITARFVEESLGSQTIVVKFSEADGFIVVTIGPKAGPSLIGFPGRGQSATQLRGALVNYRISGIMSFSGIYSHPAPHVAEKLKPYNIHPLRYS